MKKSFILKRYDLFSGKIPAGASVRLLMIADLHGACYEEDQKKLVRVIRAQHPDAVLIAGDLMIRSKPESIEPARILLRQIAGELPVFYGLGNHEKQLESMAESQEEKNNRISFETYMDYMREIKTCGVEVLRNEQADLRAGGARIAVAGLDLPKVYYRKPFPPGLTAQEIGEMLGRPDPEAFQILIAHSPRYADAYYDWGADLTVCGHYHGGLWRLGEHTGLVSPYYRLFPRYCVGGFAREDQYLIVSSGAGEHTLPIRIHNPREVSLIIIRNCPDQNGIVSA